MDAGVVRPSDLRSLLGGDVEWMTYGQDGNRLQQVRYTDGRTAARCVLRDSVHTLGGILLSYDLSSRRELWGMAALCRWRGSEGLDAEKLVTA